LSRQPDADVDERIKDADVDQDIDQGHGEYEALHRSVIGGDQRLERIRSDARPGEDPLYHDVRTDQEGEHKAGRGENRQ